MYTPIVHQHCTYIQILMTTCTYNISQLNWFLRMPKYCININSSTGLPEQAHGLNYPYTINRQII